MTTTLLYSIHQKHETIAAIAEELSSRYKMAFLYKDFRRDGRKVRRRRAGSASIARTIAAAYSASTSGLRPAAKEGGKR